MHPDLKAVLRGLSLPVEASPDELEVMLTLAEERSRVMLKLPRKSQLGRQRLEQIALARQLMNSSSSVVAKLSSLSEPLPSPSPCPQLNHSFQTVTDIGTIGNIRRLLNEWAAGVSGNELVSFGSDVQILNVTRCDVYHVVLKRVFETRRLVKQKTPYTTPGELQEASLDIEQLDVWSIAVPSNENGVYPITGTHRVVPCKQCDVQGVLWCKHCSATGNVLCKDCDGAGQVCCSCDGRKCSTCQGSGFVTCSSCKNGWRQCAACSGYRKVTCELCLGAGRLLEYYSLEVERRILEHFETLLPARLKEVVAPQRPEGEIIYDADWGQTSGQVEIDAAVERLCKRNLLFQGREISRRLQLFAMSAYFVEYSFEKQRHELCIYGGQVYARKNPLKDRDCKLAEEASLAISEGAYTKSLELLASAFSLSPHSGRAIVVLGELIRRLEAELAVGKYALVVETAERAVKLLGPNLAVKFPSLVKTAISRVRAELLLIWLTVAIFGFVGIFYLLNVYGEVYARNVFTVLAPATSVVATAVLLYIGKYLLTLAARYTAITIAAVVVFSAATITSLWLQQQYVARYKQEGLFRYGEGTYEAASSAVEAFEQAVRAETHDAELYYLLGKAARRSEQIGKAISALERACELEPSARNLAELGLALQARGERARAISLLARAVLLSSADSEYVALLEEVSGMKFYPASSILMAGQRKTVKAFLVDKDETIQKLLAQYQPLHVQELISIRGLPGLQPITLEQRAYIEQMGLVLSENPFRCSLELERLCR
ncbi:MAG: hypothetical protein RMM17_02550 [Acidobacteriota bacterium]|nr:hypothetical protein [Blastocatellia bacterium]MDW8411547.1 hypothetical protein [Acidobacteriota bacterium]